MKKTYLKKNWVKPAGSRCCCNGPCLYSFSPRGPLYPLETDCVLLWPVGLDSEEGRGNPRLSECQTQQKQQGQWPPTHTHTDTHTPYQQWNDIRDCHFFSSHSKLKVEMAVTTFSFIWVAWLNLSKDLILEWSTHYFFFLQCQIFINSILFENIKCEVK